MLPPSTAAKPVLEPVKRSKKRRSGAVSEDDPLFRLIGIGSSRAGGPEFEDKDEALVPVRPGRYPSASIPPTSANMDQEPGEFLTRSFEQQGRIDGLGRLQAAHPVTG